jgi:hypothetical protein
VSDYDIFLSYAHEDLERVRPLVGDLEAEQWRVFWDRTIPAGETWRTFIGVQLDTAPVVVVVWSKVSVESHWVASEADRANKRGVLVPVLLDEISPPLGLDHIQAASLITGPTPGRRELPPILKSSIRSKMARGTTAKLPPIEISGRKVTPSEGAYRRLEMSESKSGDTFSNVSNSTIINRSSLSHSLNSAARLGGADAEQALKEVGELVVKSGNRDACDLFNQLTEELQKPWPRKSVLRSAWDGLSKALPAVTELAGAVTAIGKLFA